MDGFNPEKLIYLLCCAYSYLFPNFKVSDKIRGESALTVY